MSTDRTKGQWIDLGIHTKACMTRMDCGTPGGAVSMWFRLEDLCDDFAGLLTTRSLTRSGFVVDCRVGVLRYV